jgi:hypothetical protein
MIYAVKLVYNEHFSLLKPGFVITGLICVLKRPSSSKNMFVITECLLTTEFVITEFHCVYFYMLKLTWYVSCKKTRGSGTDFAAAHEPDALWNFLLFGKNFLDKICSFGYLR